MAARRPPSSKSRVNLTAKSSIRPPSAMARSHTTPTLTSPTEAALLINSIASSSQNKSTKSQSHQQDDAETNIQVVIRCRRRSEREVQENSPIIVSSNGPKSQDVTIETSSPVSSLGVITLAPTRTYPFDLVFGPEADQAMIYHDVVSPMLDEVLMGYNCTLFAYGQTGTGKTYTMQGDLTPTPMGNPSSQAGMIPRVLFRLFHQLETSSTDYSVKISFVELYNEELRDLLASELSAPTGSIQPMGKGNSADNQGSLKIFDDASKKGVFIQGLEEMPVKDASDALRLLTKGSHRRQIAATKFNDHSSRSHSVFSITVHMKETSAMGDDLLKVGKLNLVDLAGSENIGRSGAENKRAKEAGMINQSLLTLGRVINALVDRSSHVPYRESKLTRLLQDSLGGRTKTCIIATISPARSNMEETLSTLDYAMRAKSIRNKPEVNQRMTRNSLLKEYVAEIERLKADVLAAREKNGIFFSEETWNQMSVEQELKQTEMEEAKKQVEIVESQLRSVREEFEQSIGLLMKRDGELKVTREKLKEAEGELEVKDGQLQVVKGALEEEIIVRQAYQANEGKLDGVALGLKQVATESICDVSSLFDKLQRKTKTFHTNSKAVTTHGKIITGEVQVLSAKLDEFIKTSTHNAQKLQTEARQFQTKELETLTSHSQRIDQQLQRLQDYLKTIQSKDEASSEGLAAMQRAAQEMQGNLRTTFDGWSETLRASCDVMCQELYSSAISDYATAEDMFKAMGMLIDTIVQQALDFVRLEGEATSDTRVLVDDMVKAEITRIREQNTSLVRALETEKVRSEKAKDELVQRVSGMLGEFIAVRDKELRQTCGAFLDENVKGEEDLSKFGQHHEALSSEISTQEAEAITSFERRRTEGKRTRDGALKHMDLAKASLKNSLSGLQGSVSTSTTTFSGEIQRNGQSFDVAFNSGLDRHKRAKRARIESTNVMVTDVQSDMRHLQRGMASSSRNVEGFVGRVLSESTGIAEITEKHHHSASSKLSTLQQTAQSLVEQGTREDIPTGLTPRKRIWEVIDKWELTQSRDALMKAWKKDGSPKWNRENVPAEEPPLPEEEHEEEQETTLQSSDRETPAPSEQSSNSTSPLALSMSSVLSTVTTIPSLQSIPLETKKIITNKSSIPSKGALTDKSTNIIGTRGSRKLR